MTERRFTDREVALILRRSVEMEERSGSSELPAARGLTLRELQEVAGEVGIDPSIVSRAAAELETRRGLEPVSVWGPSPFRREVQSIPRTLSREEMGELVRVVDREVSAQGIVGEALGSVRWTSNGRFLNTQVSIEPGTHETLVRIEERYRDNTRGPLHGIPAAYGGMFGLIYALEGLALSPGFIAVFVVLGAILGWMLGDVLWRQVSGRSMRRVRALSGEIARAAAELGLPDPSDDRA